MYIARDIPVPPMIPVEDLADEPREWHLEEMAGPHGKVTLKCDRKIVFGRSAKHCNVVFPEDTSGISRLHCEITPQQSGLLLKDLNSSYGTFLENGTQVREDSAVLLKKGDRFYLASKRVMFEVK